MKIPLIAIEEHNEAFFVWYHARETGWLAESDNILLHVDDHADLQLPFFREPIPPRNDAAAAARFTYTRTDIANFIWPTVYSGIFAKIYWLRQKHNDRAGTWRRVKLSFRRDRFPFAWRKVETFSLEPLPVCSGEVACEYAPLEPGDRLRPSAPLALDIDLDYFSAAYPPARPPGVVRIEEQFANEVLTNPYHWTRVEGNAFAVTRDANGHWVMTPREPPFYPARPTDERSVEEVIAEALTRFGAYLDEYQLRPSVIILCRSDYSGYTPRHLVRHIEAGVRELLGKRFTIEEYCLNSLLPEGWKIPDGLLRVWPW